MISIYFTWYNFLLLFNFDLNIWQNKTKTDQKGTLIKYRDPENNSNY